MTLFMRHKKEVTMKKYQTGEVMLVMMVVLLAVMWISNIGHMGMMGHGVGHDDKSAETAKQPEADSAAAASEKLPERQH